MSKWEREEVLHKDVVDVSHLFKYKTKLKKKLIWILISKYKPKMRSKKKFFEVSTYTQFGWNNEPRRQLRNQVLMLKYSLVKIGLSFIHEVTQPPSLCFILIIFFFSILNELCFAQVEWNEMFPLLSLSLSLSSLHSIQFSYLIPQLLNRVLLMFYPFLLCLVQSR
jgi:hypothetical protein